jgi:hypothetical protein
LFAGDVTDDDVVFVLADLPSCIEEVLLLPAIVDDELVRWFGGGA